MAALSRAWSWYQLQLRSRPLRTQMITSGILWAGGDCIAQSVDSALLDIDPSSSPLSSVELQSEAQRTETGMDWRRVALCSSFGFTFVGPCGHLWYEGLEHIVRHRLHLRPNSFTFIGSKVFADSFIFGPIDLLAFFSYMSLSSGSTFQQLKDDLKRDFIPAFMIEGALWPIIQIANFRFVPVRHQLLFVNAFCILDSAFLSWFKHQDDVPWKSWMLSLIVPERKT